jgi:cell division protein FtsL
MTSGAHFSSPSHARSIPLERALPPLPKAFVALVAGAILVTLSVAFLVWIRIEVLQLGYAIDQAQRQKNQLVEKVRLLELEVATLKRPERLDQVGRRELGLFPPTAEQILTPGGRP